jgi:hypothetical protein
VKVNAALSAGAVTPGSPAIDNGQYINLTSNEAGGTSTFSYQWYSSSTGSGACVAGTQISGAISATYSTTTLSTSTYYCYEVADSSSAGAESAGSTWDKITVNPDPTAVQSPSSAQSNESGQVNNFVATVTGGTAAYSYVWLVNGTDGSSLGTGAHTADYAFHPQHPATYTVNVAVVDAAGWHVWTTATTETTYPGPEVSMTASATHIDLGGAGGTVNYVGTESGGVPTITYAWYLNGTVVPGQTGLTWSFTPVGAAVYTVTFSATDADLATVTNTSTLTVYADPVVSVPTASPSTVDLTQPVTISAVASYGSGGYTYAWSNLPGGCSGTTASITCTPTVTGTFSITVKITDSFGYSATSGPLSFTIYADPAITAPVANRTSADVGQAVWFNTTLTGPGSGGDVYWWSGLPAGCTNSSTLTLGPCTLTASGTFTVVVKVRDSNGYVYKAGSLTFNVYADPAVSTPTAAPTSVDLGQWVNFSTTTSGGYKGPIFTWFNLPTGCSTSNVSKLACHPTGNGAFNVGVGVKDGNGLWVQSSTLSFTVYAAPVSGTPTFNPSAIDLSQSTVVSTVASGGLGPYTYAWTGLPAGCAAVVASFTCTPGVAGSYSVTVIVTDANGASATSPASVLTVNPDPAAIQSPSTLQTNESGQVNRFSVVASLGTAPYTYQWMVNGTAVPGATTSVFAFHPVYPVNYTINVTVTDSVGWHVWTPGVVESVYPGPHISFVASAPTIDLKGTVTFTGSENGGAAPFTYTWYLNQSIVQTGSSIMWNFTPTGAAVYGILVRVTDANLAFVNSTSLLYTVYADPVVSLPTATHASVDLGQSTTFSVTASFGSGGFSYAWSGLPGGCAGSSSSFSCSPSEVGHFIVAVTATDSNGVSVVSGALSFSVYSDPTITTPAVNRTSADVGQGITFTSTTGSGSGGNTYTWAGLPTGCTSQSTLSLVCIPASAGTFIVKVTVTDSDGFSATSQAISFTVDPAPTVTGPTATPQTIDLGRSAVFSVAASSGSGGFKYMWSGLPTGCSSNSSSTITCTPSAVGNYTVSVSVTDSNGFYVAGNPISFVVHALPTVSLSASVTTTDVGFGVYLNLSILGGVGPFAASWTLNGSAWSLPSSSAISYVFFPHGAGTYTFSVMVTDSLGGNSSASTPLEVIVHAHLAASITESPSTIVLGATALFNGSVSGGTSPFTYQWYVNGEAFQGAVSIQFPFTPTSSGTYTLTLVASDSIGQHVTSLPFTLVVTQPPSKNTGGGSFLSGPFLWILIALAIAVIIIVLVLSRRRKKPEEGTAAQAEMMAGGVAAEGAAMEGMDGAAPPAEPEMPSGGYGFEAAPEAYPSEGAPVEAQPEAQPEAFMGAPVVEPTPSAPAEEPAERPLEAVPEASQPVQAPPPAETQAPEAGADNLFDAILESAGFAVPHATAPAPPKKEPKADVEGPTAPPSGAAPAAEVEAPVPVIVPPPASSGPRCPRCGQPLPNADSQCLACELDRLNETIDAPPRPGAPTEPRPPSSDQENDLPKVCLFCKKPLDEKGFCESCNINWSALSNV